MPAISPRVTKTTDALHRAYQARVEEAWPCSEHDWRRDHLGASLIGHECDRFLWLSFRWAAKPNHDGRQLRLFSRGHHEEAWLIRDLREIGLHVEDRDATGEQRVVSWYGHFGGHLDGIVTGLAEDPRPHVLETKTHNKKSFERLVRLGVKDAKPEHYAQMQVYMLGAGLDWAFYLACCKDDDELYAERVKLDRKFAESLVARAKRIIETNVAPSRKLDQNDAPCVYVSQDGRAWPCQFRDLCWGKAVPEASCRTCVSARARTDDEWAGKWMCHLGGGTPIERLAPEQREGCDAYVCIPSAVNAQVVDCDPSRRKVTYQRADGSILQQDGPRWVEVRVEVDHGEACNCPECR